MSPTPRELPRLDHVESIAVLRANAMGDYIAAEPALTALRSAAPRAHITLLASAWHLEALAGRPGPVDEVIVLPEVPGGAAVEESDFIAGLRSRRFEIALQMHGGGRNSNPIVGALGASFTAGFQADDAPPLDATLAYQYWQPEVFKWLDVVGLLGVVAQRVRPRFPVIAEDRRAAAESLAMAGVEPDTAYVVIHPGATDPQRRWPAQRFAQVAEALRCMGLQVVVIGTPSEGPVVEEVVRNAPGAVAVSTPDFAALVGVLEGSRLLVGNDSGPRHLAEAVGTATVSIYWCGNVINAGPLSRDRHRVHISWTTHCPQCGRIRVGEPFPPRCYDEISLVSDVRTQSVIRSAEELLGPAGTIHRRCDGRRAAS